MSDEQTTSALEQLQGLLSGARTDSRAARNLARMRKANVLFGVLLHGADRLRQGEQLTQLEEQLMEALQPVLSQEELKEWGRVYREAVEARGSAVGVPEVITRRPVGEGYDFEALAEDLPAVDEEWRAQSNWSGVDVETLAAGGDFDSPEFIEGMSDWGFGVTVPARWAVRAGEEPPDPPTPDDHEVIQFKLEYDSFKVLREVGDGWPNTRDEIRWVSCGASDRYPATEFLSQEWGGNDTAQGKTCVFGPWPHPREAFNAPARLGLVLNISCWEWDTGGGHDENIIDRLRQANRNPIFNTIWSAVSAMSPTLIGLLMDVTSLAFTVIDWINKNDLSSSRTLFLDRPTLAILSDRKTLKWAFPGDGAHELKVTFTGATIPFPTGTLEYAVRTDTWSAPVALPWTSITPPALASYNGKLYAAFVREDKAVMWTRLENGVWRTPEQIGGDHSYRAPALCAAHGTLFYAVTGTNEHLYWRSFNTATTSWGGITKFQGYNPKVAPALAAFSRRLWMYHVGGDGALYLNTHDGDRWSAAMQDPADWRTDHPVALAPYNGRLWRVVTGMDEKVYFCTSDGGNTWADRGVHPTWKTLKGPALAGHGVTMWIFLRASDGTLVAAMYHDVTGQWSPTHQVGGAKPITVLDEPAAASHDGRLYVMYRR